MRLPSRIGTMSLRSMMAISANASSVAWRAAMSSLFGAGRCWARLPGTTLATNPAASRTETLILVSCMKSQFTVFRGPGERQDCHEFPANSAENSWQSCQFPGRAQQACGQLRQIGQALHQGKQPPNCFSVQQQTAGHKNGMRDGGAAARADVHLATASRRVQPAHLL